MDATPIEQTNKSVKIIINKSKSMVQPSQVNANQQVTAAMFAAKYRSKREV